MNEDLINDITFWFIIIASIIFLCFLLFSFFNIIKEFKLLKKLKKELNKSIKRLYNITEIGESYTFKDGNEIVISDKYQEDNKFYFEYKYVNQDAKTIKDLINDEHYTVTVQQFAQLVENYGRK